MAMLSSSTMNIKLFKPPHSISNNYSSSASCVDRRNSLPSRRRQICKNSSPPSAVPSRKPPSTKTNKLLLRRLSGSTDGIPYFTTLSTTTNFTDDDDDVKKGTKNWAITQHKDYIPLPFPKTSPYLVEVVGSCDGLVCLADGYDEGKAAIWNPSTNDYKILPASSIQRPPSADFCFYPSCGFGFDPKSQDYKMVRFVSFAFETDGYFDHKEEYVEVYSLKTDSWTEVNPPSFQCVWYYFSAITIDRRCYWLASSDYDLILSFDFSTQQFLPPIPLPHAVNITDWVALLEFDHASLALLNWNKHGEFNVWALNVKDRSAWSHVSVIRHSSSLSRPIGFVGNDKLFFEGEEDFELLVYDCAAREMKSLGIYDDKHVMNIVPFSSNCSSAPPLSTPAAH